MAAEHTYYVRPVAGVWHVTWNDASDMIGSWSCQAEAQAVAEMLARHMRTQGKTAKVQVSEPEVRRATWGRSIVNHQSAA
ncbi:MAG: hypothetical protein PSX79_07525 [bacterium]|nr:hypothetical protein [Alphaproteobacteria bacterium]MDI1364701.1 hypothetical protein [bacterium]